MFTEKSISTRRLRTWRYTRRRYRGDRRPCSSRRRQSRSCRRTTPTTSSTRARAGGWSTITLRCRFYCLLVSHCSGWKAIYLQSMFLYCWSIVDQNQTLASHSQGGTQGLKLLGKTSRSQRERILELTPVYLEIIYAPTYLTIQYIS